MDNTRKERTKDGKKEGKKEGGEGQEEQRAHVGRSSEKMD
jgi:hypothetical protein